MTHTTVATVPDGFELMQEGMGFSDNLQPWYRRLQGDELHFGLVVQEQHCNLMGICHGGMLMTMADVAAAANLNLARDGKGGSPTINLSVDFISAGRLGDWIQSQIQLVSPKRRFGFCQGLIVGSEGPVVRFSGSFYFPDHKGMWKNKPSDEGGALAGLTTGRKS